MPTRNVNLTQELDRAIDKRVKSGDYENASEVVRAALRALAREESSYEAEVAAFNKLLDEGERSGIYEGDPFEAIAKKHGFKLARPAKRRRKSA